jgi:hypothetical protein
VAELVQVRKASAVVERALTTTKQIFNNLAERGVQSTAIQTRLYAETCSCDEAESADDRPYRSSHAVRMF